MKLIILNRIYHAIISVLCFDTLIQKVKNIIYYESVVLYGYNLRVFNEYKQIPEHFSFVKASLNDIEELYNDPLNTDLRSIKWDLWKEKITDGTWKGFICRDRGHIIAQAFYSKEDIFFGGTKWVVLTLPPKACYGFKLYTRADYRGKGLGQTISSYRWNNAKKDGINKFYTVIYSNNKVSRHNEEKIGGYIIGHVLFLNCRFFNKIIISPLIFLTGIKVKKITEYT